MFDNKDAKKVRILSNSRQPFQDRRQAGQLLAGALVELRDKKPVVLGIPRGGLVVAQGLAQGLEADLDIILSRKLGSPGQPELAMGALAENGSVFLNPDVVGQLAIPVSYPVSYIEQEKQRQIAEIRRRSQLIRAIRAKVPIQGRIAVVTDDGAATGATLQAAIWALRQENPQKLIAAIPVASEEAVARLAADVDELICLRLPADFWAVGQFYLNFEQVTDNEVLEILRNT
jgi:putative phosphoribosyl transferase